MYSPPSSGDWKSKSRCPARLVPSEVLSKGPSRPLSQPLVAAPSQALLMSSRGFFPTSLSVCPSLRTSVTQDEAPALTQCLLILTNDICKDPISNKVS